MQALKSPARVSVELSKTCKGKPRRRPVWVMRYRLPSGKDSRKVLTPAWTKRSRPPQGYLTEREALTQAEAFAAEHSGVTTDARRTFSAALGAFIDYCREEKGLRGSTLHGYLKIGERLAARPWRRSQVWGDRVLDTFDAEDLLAVRRELVQAGRRPDTINHYRRVVRGIFGTAPSSPALAWEWKAARPESEGKLHVYTPEQVDRLIAAAHSEKDAAIYTLASEAGPRVSEILALEVGQCDFAAEMLRFEDGQTATGGRAGNKGRRVRPVPMTANVCAVLVPFCQGKPATALVFEHDEKPGEPMCGISLYRRFISASGRAGLPRIRLHDLRHTFGTQAARELKIHEVQALMGHRSIKTTERYLHYVPDPDTSAKLSSLWTPRPKPTAAPDAPARLRLAA